MKRKRLNILTLSILFTTWLFVGIKADDEFNEYSTFFKYKPTWQVYFKSTLGMQDMPQNYPAELFVKETIYDEFVNDTHYSHEGLFPYLADILILISLTLIGMQIYQITTKKT